MKTWACLIASSILLEFPLAGSYYDDYGLEECAPPAPCPCESKVDFYAFGDYLYWYATESDMSYAIKGTLQNSGSIQIQAVTVDLLIPDSIKETKASWDPGFRVGAGFAVSDRWDMKADWTHFHNKTHASASVPDFFVLQTLTVDQGTQMLLSPWVNPILSIYAGPRPPIWDFISASWSLNLDIIDITFQRDLCIGDYFSFDPYFGVRLAQATVRNKYLAQAHVIFTSTDALYTDRVSYRSHFRGAGLFLGLEPTCHIGSGFSLFGDGAFSLLWGRYGTKRKEVPAINVPGTPFPDIPISNLRDRFNGMQPILDLAAGLRYEKSFCCDSWKFLIEVGWENHTWFDNVSKIQIEGRIDDAFLVEEGDYNVYYSSYDKVYTSLSFSGLFARAQLEF